MATYPVKYLHSAMRGAPVFNGSAGKIVAALDACLIDGFGAVPVTSIAVASGVATVAVNSGDWFEDGSVILIAGATPGALNGEQRVLSHTDTAFTFATSATDGVASGTITAKYAPAGSWEIVFSGTNKRVYRSTDPTGLRRYFRIDDSNTGASRWAVVRGYESMSDVDTGAGSFPLDATVSRWWRVTAYQDNDTTVRAWRLFADPASVLWMNEVGLGSPSNYKSYNVRGFGDGVPLAPGGDGWQSYVSYNGSNASDFQPGALCGSNGTVSLVRDIGGAGGAVASTVLPWSGSGTSGATGALGPFPSAVNGGLMMSELFFSQSDTDKTPRAGVPGVRFLPQSLVYKKMEDGDVVIGVGDLSGRRMIMVPYYGAPISSGKNDSFSGLFAVDADGPWR